MITSHHGGYPVFVLFPSCSLFSLRSSGFALIRSHLHCVDLFSLGLKLRQMSGKRSHHACTISWSTLFSSPQTLCLVIPSLSLNLSRNPLLALKFSYPNCSSKYRAFSCLQQWTAKCNVTGMNCSKPL